MKETEKNSQRHIDTNFLKRIPGSSNVTSLCVPLSRTENYGRSSWKGRLGKEVFIQGGLMLSKISFTVEKRGQPIFGNSQQALALLLSMLLKLSISFRK